VVRIILPDVSEELVDPIIYPEDGDRRFPETLVDIY
jgi:hypothetical protein